MSQESMSLTAIYRGFLAYFAQAFCENSIQIFLRHLETAK
jgi:hypothetical protein